ncbi:tlg2p-like protein a [Nymphaea colorata]|nr:tlg2p-like protein a [Nymphaea colorata]XP_031488911.1 tlg2p-like protein a [Nymphaea colorata]XP_031488912.1 tlg2p-like protein a [Nymphaea colorata]XP_031488913.1 tlg2p-like protein a [Nymphaea colorata]XP_031488914.1 tlg2p-like protein a [Nymphaea colorata]XP_031488915.1 tlg2p-like protein a [Nymphaea colorata]XP_031488916.1 tlg2p-like protein a [Nymphaea colorata]
MATRNRTQQYKQYRDGLRNARVHSSPSPSSSYSSGGPVIEMTSLLHQGRSYTPLSTEDPGNSSKGAISIGLPPSWVDISEEITIDMQHAKGKFVQLAKAHEGALFDVFNNNHQHVIEALTQEITQLLKRSERNLQKLSAHGHSEDSNVRKNVQRSLATDLQKFSMEFRKKQSSYLKSLRQQKEGKDQLDLEISLNNHTSRGKEDGFIDMGFDEHQISGMQQKEAFTVEREREINQVVQSVNELAQIMKDLSVLVIDQGTIVDRIDYNIQNVAATVDEGLKQLQKAERTQRKGGMVMCATVLVIMCFVMLILLILKTILF